MKRLLVMITLAVVACTPQPSLGYEIEMSFHPNTASVKISLEDSNSLILEDVAGVVCALFESASSSPPILLSLQVEDASTDTITVVDVLLEECPDESEYSNDLMPGRMTL